MSASFPPPTVGARYLSPLAHHLCRYGCPFKLKDIVRLKHGNGMEGKVVGLPTVADALGFGVHKDKTWVHWCDGSRDWRMWGELLELRRSPPRAKRPVEGPSTLYHSMGSRFSQPTLPFGNERRAAWRVRVAPPPPTPTRLPSCPPPPPTPTPTSAQ